MELYYHLRNDRKAPVITVCLIAIENEYYARGLAICSHQESPDKAYGRGRARERAVMALLSGSNDLPITRGKAYSVIESTGPIDSLENTIFEFKSCFQPELTHYEAAMIKTAKAKK